MSIGAYALIWAFAIVATAVFLLLLSGLAGRYIFKVDLPLPRAAKSVAIALAFIVVLNLVFPTPGRGMWTPSGMLLIASAAILVFLWEWRHFTAKWIDDDATGPSASNPEIL